MTSSLPNVSLREKSAWICLVTTVAVYVPYFIHVRSLIGEGQFHAGGVVSTFLVAVVIQILLSILAFALFAFRHRRGEPYDERDAAMEARAFRWAYRALGAACFFLMAGVPLLFKHSHAPLETGEWVALLLSQLLLLGFVVAEVTRYAILAVSYRLGSRL